MQLLKYAYSRNTHALNKCIAPRIRRKHVCMRADGNRSQQGGGVASGGPTWDAALPVPLHQLPHAAHQLPPHVIEQQVQHGLPPAPVRRHRGQAAAPPVQLRALLLQLLVPARKGPNQGPEKGGVDTACEEVAVHTSQSHIKTKNISVT